MREFIYTALGVVAGFGTLAVICVIVERLSLVGELDRRIDRVMDRVYGLENRERERASPPAPAPKEPTP